MAIKINGFVRCPRCGKMWGPTVACTHCGWSVQCGWCASRYKIPGQGWVIHPQTVVVSSHGMCVWCACRLRGLGTHLVDIAAERLGISPGLVEFTVKESASGNIFYRLGRGNHTGLIMARK